MNRRATAFVIAAAALVGLGVASALAATPASAFAFITQNGWELNVINDAGEPSRGWVDYPGRIWIRQAEQGAIYSPDAFTIEFDRGTIWQRAPLGPPPRR